MEIKLNGKALIGLAMLSAGLAFGNFVSIVDSKSSGGIVIEKETMDIGSVVFRMDDKNPSVIYGGTWELIKGDAAIRLGDGTKQNISTQGNNEMSVPIPEHTHTATQVAHSHDKGSMDIVGSFGNGFYGEFGGTNASGAFSKSGTKGATKYTSETWVSNGPLLNFNAKNGWSGETGLEAPTITVQKEGIKNAKIDVRGEYITINVWQRIN